MIRKFLRFRYTAIRRYGDKNWVAADGYIEFNPNYTVGVSVSEKGILSDTDDYPYMVELSNGTRFLCFIHDYGNNPGDEILSSQGEAANRQASEYSYTYAAENAKILNK